MKNNKSRDFQKTGIYCIRNIINNKVYIGKAKCIYKRIKGHITALNTRNKDENEHLIRSWYKYGRDNFEYFVVEYLDLDEKLLSARELYWMNYYESLNPKKGYNKRYDSSTGMIVHESTRKKLSDAHKLRYIKFPELKKRIQESRKKYYKDNPEALKEMGKRVSEGKRKFIFHKCNEQEEILKTYYSTEELLLENPTYKMHNIYSVCSGAKKRIYGYKWKKELIIKDIVQTI